MRSRWMTVALAPAVALTVNCSDSSGPVDSNVERLELAFCASELPVWFAFQNEGGAWTRVQPTASNVFQFDATSRVAISYTHDFGDEWVTEVFYTTVDEVRPLSGVACTETLGTKNVTGSVASVPVGSRAEITFSGADDEVTAPTTSFALSGIANNPQDFVAHREVIVDAITGTPNRIVIRRAIDATNNAVLPVVDFASEGQSVATHTASISGLLSGQDNYYDIEFSTASGTDHVLHRSQLFSTSSQTLYGVPSGMTQTGDMHRIQMNADGSASEGYRTVIQWARNAGDKTFSFGAALNQPSITKVASAPYARMRVTLAAQPDYDDFVTAFFVQGTERSVLVTVTDGYVEGPITEWTPEVPDFTAAGGHPPDAALQNNTDTEWFVEAYDGSLAAYIGGTPVDGATVRYAGRANVASTLQLTRAGASRSSVRRATTVRRAFSR